MTTRKHLQRRHLDTTSFSKVNEPSVRRLPNNYSIRVEGELSILRDHVLAIAPSVPITLPAKTRRLSFKTTMDCLLEDHKNRSSTIKQRHVRLG